MSERDRQIEAAIRIAVTQALNKLGVAAFRRTSLFGSNERESLAKAA